MNHNPKAKSTNSIWLWWKVDNEQINKEVENYHSQKFFSSSRGVSIVCILLSSIVTTLFIFTGYIDRFAIVDISIYIFLGTFIFFGHRWAIVSMMVLWTFEKGLQIVGSLTPKLSLGVFLIAYLWWTAYMSAFYKAYLVEKIRKSKVHIKETSIVNS